MTDLTTLIDGVWEETTHAQDDTRWCKQNDVGLCKMTQRRWPNMMQHNVGWCNMIRDDVIKICSQIQTIGISMQWPLFQLQDKTQSANPSGHVWLRGLKIDETSVALCCKVLLLSFPLTEYYPCCLALACRSSRVFRMSQVLSPRYVGSSWTLVLLDASMKSWSRQSLKQI